MDRTLPRSLFVSPRRRLPSTSFALARRERREFCRRVFEAAARRLLAGSLFLFLEQVKQPGERQMAVLRLRTAVRSGHDMARGPVSDGCRRAHLVHVLASGTSRSGETFLEVLDANAKRIHSLQQLIAAAHI